MRNLLVLLSLLACAACASNPVPPAVAQAPAAAPAQEVYRLCLRNSNNSYIVLAPDDYISMAVENDQAVSVQFHLRLDVVAEGSGELIADHASDVTLSAHEKRVIIISVLRPVVVAPGTDQILVIKARAPDHHGPLPFHISKVVLSISAPGGDESPPVRNNLREF